MRTLRTISEVRAALESPRRAGMTIGLVPTMGTFHEGHLSLIRRAREECDEVVVSLFVNPTQFNEVADLTAYPRDESRDAVLAADAGADLLFAPAVAEMYPNGFATTVSVAGLTDTLEGSSRGRSHFDGVTTVVTKLLIVVAPHVAYFGQKDAQQTLIVRRLVRDLGLPIRIGVCPTVREPDGLAMSSRNVRLTGEERERAVALHRALTEARVAVSGGERDAAAVKAAAVSELDRAGILTEYFELVSADTLTPVAEVEGPVLAVVAARVGDTRLIDNQMLTTDRGTAALRRSEPSPATVAGS
jgi:pantoate--beta-alanine ligase